MLEIAKYLCVVFNVFAVSQTPKAEELKVTDSNNSGFGEWYSMTVMVRQEGGSGKAGDWQVWYPEWERNPPNQNISCAEAVMSVQGQKKKSQTAINPTAKREKHHFVEKKKKTFYLTVQIRLNTEQSLEFKEVSWENINKGLEIDGRPVTLGDKPTC